MLIPLEILFRKYKLKIRGVLHVGAHECEELLCYSRLRIRNIYWVEAMKNKVDKMRLKYPRQKIINTVVSDKDGEEVTFNVANNGESSSILELGTHKQEHPHIHYVKSYSCKTKTLSTVIKDENIDIKNINFLNLDIQGAELKALKGMEKYLKDIDYIYSEINKKELYIGCALLEEIDEYLQQFGFSRVETSMCGNFGWGDAFYIKMNSSN